MILTSNLSERIVVSAQKYLGQPYDWHIFDCVHFILAVYQAVGIVVPRIAGKGYPPSDFQLSAEEFGQMPLGHSVFLKRRTSTSDRIWTHAALIISPTELIHCSRHFGRQVVITSKAELLEIYALAPQPPRL